VPVGLAYELVYRVEVAAGRDPRCMPPLLTYAHVC
jgi:hypothetical protein